MARKILFPVVLLALLAAPLAAHAAAAQHSLEQARQAAGAPGVVVGVLRPGQAPAYATAGVVDMESEAPPSPDSLFAIGSITKMFIAVVVQQLAVEGRLGLDDKLARYLPDFPHADQITLRMLLQHHSGIGDPLRENMEACTAGGTASVNPILLMWLGLALQKQWTPQQLVELVATFPFESAPGTRCAYSNGNFLLLGRVVQLVTGHEVSQEIRTRILTPLGMSSTLLAGEEPLPASPSRCYMIQNGSYVDCLALENASFAWTAGAMASTAPDLLRFGEALFSGKLLPEAQMHEMLSFIPMESWGCEYGLGVMRHGTAAGARMGHTGRTAGFSSSLWFYPATGAVVVALANLQTCPTQGLEEAALNLPAAQ